MGPTRKPNVCSRLSRRTLGFFSRDAGVVQRTNLGILRALVCQKSTTFKNVWTTHSRAPISYERGRIYFDNYRCCVSSVASEPRKLYEMPKCSKSEKIEDALLWECPVGEILPNPSDYKSSLIALTAHNWLFRISANTGKILEKIYLASYCKFRYLSWDTPQEVLVVKSAQNKASAMARQAGIQQPVLLYLAVFRVLPFSLVGILEISKKIFGSVTDATLSHGILIVMYSSGLVRLYSFQAITEQTHHHCCLRCRLWRVLFRLEGILGTTSSHPTRRSRKEFSTSVL
ncbi:DDB1- and CUL4-associated factor 17 isoform X4 [Ochotona curzoniae]|uniref:DDB1- and CUL4-associated factor 17 isoform X4 n=1 Tax=Ochotona curzoniae TaxID=130825 RepID=UPI001B34A2C7|nr:DDB1- and CUL4-associated factor 17 isoform X4 [Ochotona curzoniae]